MTGKKKTENNENAFGVKVALRRWALDQVENPRVLDVFSGPQKMREAVYRGLPYAGIDKKKQGPDQLVGDNRRILRALKLDAWNVVDLDAYGEPWEQLRIITKLRPTVPGERLAFVLTVGCIGPKLGALSKLASACVGSKTWVVGWEGARLAVDVIEHRLLREFGTVEARRRAERPGNKGMIYDAIIVQAHRSD